MAKKVFKEVLRFRVDPKTKLQIEALADEFEVSQSDVIRTVLTAYSMAIRPDDYCKETLENLPHKMAKLAMEMVPRLSKTDEVRAVRKVMKLK